jgi:ParB family chromosome partitioning protein
MGALMARKNLLRDLLAQAPAPAEAAPSAEARPARGTIGAVSRGIADHTARAVVDLDPTTIDAGGVVDRLEHDEEDHARLVASIRDYGQQVPVLVRPHPEAPGRYRIVYGRRRVLALRDLGRPVKALVRDLDDLGAVLAQGQENTARRDLSFIEKANFARQMHEAGYERRIVCDALSIDKTVISRMFSVVERVPPAVIALVGSAPGIGRERWLAFAGLYAARPFEPEEGLAMLAASNLPATADSRFETLDAWLRSRLERRVGAAPTAAAETIRTADGRRIAEVTRGRTGMTLALRRKDTGDFEDWLAGKLAELHEEWKTATKGATAKS